MRENVSSQTTRLGLGDSWWENSISHGKPYEMHILSNQTHEHVLWKVDSTAYHKLITFTSVSGEGYNSYFPNILRYFYNGVGEKMEPLYLKKKHILLRIIRFFTAYLVPWCIGAITTACCYWTRILNMNNTYTRFTY